jgi:hypothetical protein
MPPDLGGYRRHVDRIRVMAAFLPPAGRDSSGQKRNETAT